MNANDFLSRQETKDYLAINDAEFYLYEIKNTLKRLEQLCRENYRLKEYVLIMSNIEKIKESLLAGTTTIRSELAKIRSELNND